MQGLQSMLIHAAIVLPRCARLDWTLCALGIGVPISSTVHNSLQHIPLPPSAATAALADQRRGRGKPENLPPSGRPVVGQCKLETLPDIHLLSSVSRAGVGL